MVEEKLQCPEHAECKNKNCFKSAVGSFKRWAQTIGHESNRGSQSPVPNQMNNTHTFPPANRISSLVGSNSGNVDNRLETRAILSFILLKELGSEFEGSDKLVVMANSAPPCTHQIYSEILKIPSEQRKGIKNLTDQVSLDPRSYQHDITKVFKEFVSHTPQCEAGKPTFGMLLCLIVYLIELCRRFLDNDRGYEIPSIHNTATRLMLDAEHQLSPANWTEYLENHPPRERSDRPPLERRPSAAANAAAMIFHMVEAYSKYTK
ncbi:uncharacterized protein LOC134816597 isoform X2 [Bolinopsis microptera]|uniref:uncharacterized protein LOC134816597 isoform X2 n=1 Tax=Bolinopsis microptera TaxID=2820187 RepID=UPI0030799BF9